ncbi:hypothetical protein CC80DRAFT_496928 [Byssothecium circinans]|uniref:Uncharacterized protein n=1 Tax=Byssothecium circinans TaxID=147558 RepID=A0A6A5TMZ3_9PLEO|nr:hypothetical protein CC80DRAFT_496928 [Byssothecium circinans]
MIRISCAASLRRTTTTSAPLSRTSKLNANIWNSSRFEGPARVARRWNASSGPVAHTAPESTKTIPGPNWLWLEPIYEPFRAYGRVQQRRPYTTQFISALVIYFVGDIVAQSIGASPAVKEEGSGEEEEERGWVQAWAEDRDWARTARALFIGGAAAVPGYRWFLWLGNSFNYGSKVLSLTTKVVVNQLFFTPLFNSYFFGMQSLLSGASVSDTITRIRHTVPTSWINSCKLWPAVTAFMFVYVPIQYRSIVGGVIAIGWQTYLSMLNQRAAAVEEAEAESEGESAKEEVKGVKAGEVEDVDCSRKKCAA